jgi:hypothetical protein
MVLWAPRLSQQCSCCRRSSGMCCHFIGNSCLKFRGSMVVFLNIFLKMRPPTLSRNVGHHSRSKPHHIPEKRRHLCFLKVRISYTFVLIYLSTYLYCFIYSYNSEHSAAICMCIFSLSLPLSHSPLAVRSMQDLGLFWINLQASVCLATFLQTLKPVSLTSLQRQVQTTYLYVNVLEPNI